MIKLKQGFHNSLRHKDILSKEDLLTSCDKKVKSECQLMWCLDILIFSQALGFNR